MSVLFVCVLMSFSRGAVGLSVIYECGIFWSHSLICDYQQCDILTIEDSDEHAQPPAKLRNPKCCSVSSLTVTKYSSDLQRL